MHYKAKDTLTLVAAALAAAIVTGCSGSGDEPLPVAPDNTDAVEAPMHFVGPQTAESRANLEQSHLSFHVWARKHYATDPYQAVMDGYKVLYSSSTDPKWKYDDVDDQYLKYWDLSASSYLFSAYAPVATTANTVTVATADLAISISNIIGNNATAATDWMIARHQRDNATTVADTDLLSPTSEIAQPTALTSRVPMHFHHIMSQVEFRAFSSTDESIALTDVVITAAAPGFSTKADYSQSAATAWNTTYLNWKNHSTPSTALVSKDAITIPSGRDNAVALRPAALQVPQQLAGLTFTVTAMIGDQEVTGTFSLGDSWCTDTRYIYYLSFTGPGSGADPVILFDIDAEPWLEGEADDVTLTDW